MIRAFRSAGRVAALMAGVALSPCAHSAGDASAGAAADAASAGTDASSKEPDTSALRKRVQRFYVLSYLGRPSEMWDSFSAALKRQLGDDKPAYVHRSQRDGYELYQSKIQAIRIAPSGLTATVDVSLQAKLPGSPQAAWRRHRMLWAYEDKAWRYAGSMDVTDAADDVPMDTSLLQAVPGVGGSAQPEYAPGSDLLPERVPLQVAAATPPPGPAPPTRAAPVSPASPSSRSKERWDLVAVAPDGSTPPSPAADASQGVAAPATASARPAAAAPTAALAPSAIVASSAMAEPPASHEARVHPATHAPPADPELAALVDRAATGIAVRRVKALKAIGESRDPAIPALLVAALPRALPDAQAGFLEILARRGGGASSAPADAARERVAVAAVLVRRAALGALAALGSASDAPLIAARLQVETDHPARLAALDALGTLGGDVSPALSKVLADEHAPASERAAAADAIGRAHALDGEPAVLAVLKARGPQGVLGAATGAAGHLGTPACVSALEALATAAPAEVAGNEGSRLLALRALAMAGAAGSGDRLARQMVLLGNDASSHDVELVAATGEISPLLALLRHPRPLVRGRAAELASRMVSSPADASRVVAAISEALAEEGDDATLVTFSAARARLAGGLAAQR